MRYFGLAAVAAMGSLGIGAAGPLAPVAHAASFKAPTGFHLEKDGTLIHEKSRTRFPLTFEGFARTSNYAFDPGGKNVAVVYTYSVGQQMVEARIALVHILMMSAHEHYAGLSPVIGTYFQDMAFTGVRPIGDGALQLPGMAPDAAWQGRFRAMRKRQPYLLSLTTVDFGYWSARVTAAYPQARAAEAQARIVRLIAQIQATGPKHH